MQVQKVTDPLKIVTDPVLLSHLEKLGVDKDYVEFVQDYAPAYVNGKRVKGQSHYAKFYLDRKSDNGFAVVSQLPMVDADGNPVEAGWQAVGEGFEAKNNLFIAKVDGLTTTLTVRNDQPDGRKAGHEVAYRPQLFLDGAEQRPISESPKLLETDPLNNNYSGNTLEWDFGICKRRLRIVEGKLLGHWIFEKNPGGEVEIVYNQQGDFRLRLGQYAASEDKETVSLDAFNKVQYPLTVSDSATFYPDAHAESTSFDGRIWYSNDPDTWANIHNAANGTGSSDTDEYLNANFTTSATTNKWNQGIRSIILFDTSGLPDTAVISAATLFLYGYYTGGANFGSTVNIYASTPASNTAIAVGDYSQVGTTAFATAIAASSFNIGTPGTSNDFTLNASGIAAISKTGVSKFGFREANHDAANSEPAWESAKVCGCVAWSSDKGTGYKPKLVVTYTTGEAKTSGDSGSGAESISLRDLGATETGSAIEGSLAIAAVISSDGGAGSEIGGLMKSFYSSDGGSGADGLKMISGKAGADMRLRGQQGQVGLPHKEVSI